MKVKIDGFERQINAVLKNYSDDIIEGTKVLAKKVANQAKKETSAGSPVRTGAYAKDWAVKMEEERLSANAIVYNKKHYQVAHLLEKGHAKRGGGRVAAIPHIQGPEDRAIEAFEKGVRELAQG